MIGHSTPIARPWIPAHDTLTNLDFVLDPTRMLPLLRHSDNGIRDCKVVRVRYKPKSNCVVLYEANGNEGKPLFIYAKLYAEDVAQHVSRHSLYCRYFPELRIAVSPYPYDLRLSGLRRAAQPEKAQKILAAAFGTKNQYALLHSWEGWTLIGYKPERRCVIRGVYHPDHGQDAALADGQGYFLKFYARHQGEQTVQRHRYLAEEGGFDFIVPRPLAYVEKYCALLLEEAEGVPLEQCLSASKCEAEDALIAAARALVAWHRLPIALPVTASANAEIRSAAVGVDSLLGDPESPARALAEALLEGVPSAPTALLHGDFHCRQLILGADGVIRVLDLDELTAGDPANDLAYFCAHAQTMAVLGEIDADRADWAGRFLVESYQSMSGRSIPPRRLDWHLSAALLREAEQPFRRFHAEWPSKTRELFTLAQRAWSGHLR